MNKTRGTRIIPFTVAVLLFFAISYLTVTLPSKDYKLISGNKIDLNHGWTVEYDDVVMEDVSLPYNLRLDKDKRYTASLKLPVNLDNHIRLRLRSSMQDVIVYIDGIEVYKDIKDRNGGLVAPDASLWHILELPNYIGGKELRIEMVSPTEEFSGMLNEVYAGQGIDLIFDIIMSNSFKLILSGIFFIFGFFTIVLSKLFKYVEDNRLIYLGIFGVFVAVWMLSESKVLQLFVGNRFIIGGLSYIAIPMIAISFVMFLKESVLKKYRSIMVVFAVILLFGLLLNSYLQLSGIFPYISSMQITVILIVLIVMASIFFMVLEWRKFDNQQAKMMLIYCSTSGVFLLAEIVAFLYRSYNMTGYLTGLGILLFFIQMSYNTFRYVRNMIQNEKESEILKKLAYKDILTNIGNRAAFEKFIDELRMSEMKKSFRLTMMDINNLKYINDNFGHKEGDEAIKACARVIENNLKPYGECFRLGGDEFACVVFDLDDTTYQEQISKMREELNSIEFENDYILDIAIGSDSYDNSKYDDFSDFIHETDLKMYSNKKRIKETLSV